MKRFLEKLFTPKTEDSSVPRSPFSGPTVALYQDNIWGYMSGSALLEFPNAGAVKQLPPSFLAPFGSEHSAFESDFGGSEKPIQLEGGIKASTAVSGGRSFYRPAWFSHLDLCGGIVALQDSRHSWASFFYHLQNCAVPDAPFLLIITDDSRSTEPRVFDKAPTVEELAEKLKIDLALLKARPVRIIFTSYETPAPAAPEPESDDKGKGKMASQPEAAPAPPAPKLEHPAVVAEALEWLSSHVVVDAWAIGNRQQNALRAAEKKAQAEQRRAAAKASISSLFTSSKPTKDAAEVTISAPEPATTTAANAA